MNLSLDLSLKLQQKLSFQMIQSLKLLQVNTLQLEQLVRNELEMNPVLETGEDEEPAEEEKETEEEKAEEAEDELKTAEEEVDWEEYLDEGFDLSGRISDEAEPDKERYEPTPVYETSLDEHLSGQLAELKITDRQRLLATFIIGCLGDDGYLKISLDDIAEATQAAAAEVEEALAIVWRLEPAGVGARSLQECLVLQLQRKGLHDSLAMRIVASYWELFEKLKVPDIAHHLGVSVQQVQETIDVLRTLNPQPGSLVGSKQSAAIIPDLVVESVEGKFVVTLNDRNVPSLHISRAYGDVIRRGSTAKREVKDFVRGKLNGATWLIRAIEQRKATMLRVMNAIVERQREFFEKGPPNLSPLKLQDIADMIGMHISTISRVTNGKYVQTPHGIFELKYFFTEALGRSDDGGEDVSSERVKTRIRELVQAEAPERPLSDQQIAEALSKDGFSVARRTVAKYREQLKILPTRLRMKYV